MSKEQTAADKAMEEVREVHRGIREKWLTHNRTEIQFEVQTLGEGVVEVRTVDGKLYLYAPAEAILDRQGVIELRRQLDQAFQAVS